MNDDQIIADGLKDIRQGLTENNLDLVYQGYKYITGEDLKPANVGKLNRIRQLMGLESDENENQPVRPDTSKRVIEPLAPDISGSTVKELKQELITHGYSDNDLKGKKKNELIALLKAKQIVAIEQKGGKTFGRGNIQIISDEFDPEMAERNERVAQKTLKVKRNPFVEKPPVKYNAESDYRLKDLTEK